MANKYKLQSNKDMNNYLNQLYGGSPPGMDYYRQLGAQKRQAEEAEKARQRAIKEAEAARKKAEREAEKARKDEEKRLIAQKKAIADGSFIGPPAPSKNTYGKTSADKEKPHPSFKGKDFIGPLLPKSDDPSDNKPHPSFTPGKVKSTSNKPKQPKSIFSMLTGLGKKAVKGAGKAIKGVAEDNKKIKDTGLSKSQLFVRGAGNLIDGMVPFTDPIKGGLLKDLPNAKWLQDTFQETDNRALNFTDAANDIAGNLVPGVGAYKGAERILDATSGISKLGRAGVQANKSTGTKLFDEAQKGALGTAMWSAQNEVGKVGTGQSGGIVDALRNVSLDSTIGAIADPALMGILGLAGKGVMKRGTTQALRGADVPETQVMDSLAKREPVMPFMPTVQGRNVLSKVPGSEVQQQLSKFGSLPKVETTFQPSRSEFPAEQFENITSERGRLQQMLKDSEAEYVAKRVEEMNPVINEKEVADSAFEWEQIREKRREYEEIKKRVEKFSIPELYREEYSKLVPRSFIDNKANHDIFNAAEAVGLPGDHDGALELGRRLRDLQQSTQARKYDVMTSPEYQYSDAEVEELKRIAKLEYADSDDAKGIQSMLDSLDSQPLNIDARTETKVPDFPMRRVQEPKPQPKPKQIAKREISSTQVPQQPKQPQKFEDMPSPIADRKPKKGGLDPEIPKEVAKINSRGIKNTTKDDLISFSQPAKDVEAYLLKQDAKGILNKLPDGSLSFKDSLSKGIRATTATSKRAAESIKSGYQPIIQKYLKAGVKTNDFESYVAAKHFQDIKQNNMDKAKEANKIIAKLETESLSKTETAKLEAELDKLEMYILPEEATDDWIKSALAKGESNKVLQQAQKEFVQEQQKDIKSMIREGLISEKEGKDILARHPNYVSLRRDIDSLTGKGTGSKASRVGQPVKARKQGSTVKIKSPLESAFMNRYRTLDAVAKNNALKKIHKLAEADSGNLFFEPSNKAIEGRTVTFWDDGKEHHYIVPERMMDMFASMGERESSKHSFLRGLEKAAEISKKGMTHYNPKFLLKSPVRDTINAMFTSRTGMGPVDVVAGFLDATMGPQLSRLTGGKFKSYNEIFKEMGGDYSSWISMDVNTLAQTQKALEKKALGKGTKVINPFEGLEKFGSAMESGPRLAEFRSAKKKGYSDADALFEAIDVIDYADTGRLVKKLNRVAPYLGATIKGNIRVLQAIKENPVKATRRGIAYISAPTVAAYSLRYADSTTDEQRSKINNMPEWQKNTFWAIPHPTDGKSIFMIPKGFLVTQIFANPIERALDTIYSDEKKSGKRIAKETAEDFWTALQPPTSLAVISTLQDVARNQDSFLGMPIEDDDMQKKPKEERYNSFTSELAKTVGKMTGILGLSPAQIDHMIKGFTGGLGKDILDFSDNVIAENFGTRPAKTRTNEDILNPLSQFKFNETGASKYREELYQAQKKESDTKSQVRSEYKESTGRTMASDKAPASQVKNYNDIFKEIGKEIAGIRENIGMTAAEKKEAISRLRNEERRYGDQLAREGVLNDQDANLDILRQRLGNLGPVKKSSADLKEQLRKQLAGQGMSRTQINKLLDGKSYDELKVMLGR